MNRSKLILAGCLILNKKKEILLLFKKKHKCFETPGGKLDAKKDKGKTKIEKLRNTARREALEELGKISLSELEYFGSVDFIIPDGRKARVYKFSTSIMKGKPKLMEPKEFSCMKWIPIKRLEQYPISPDLKKLSKKIKKKLATH